MATVRMSVEQKKAVILDIVRSSNSFYRMAEIERLGCKKGVVEKTIKDVLQQLVDEGMVMSEKVGSNVLYWSLESDGIQKKIVQCRALEDECKALLKEIEEKRACLDRIRETKEQTEETVQMQRHLERLTGVEEGQSKELRLFADSDPRVYDKLVSDRREMVEKTNKIVDDIYAMQDYVCNKFSMDKREFSSSFGVPQDLDYF
jgi:predicted transcriptional regulator